MNCFVIMPFSSDFDDVYVAIKSTVEEVVMPRGGRCFRLDEVQPAGRITDRLLRAIESAGFCVADVTEGRPNVMWEVGYAMALGKPIIFLTQRISELPFDIKDMQAQEYDRANLSRTLSLALKKMILDTLQVSSSGVVRSDGSNHRDEIVGTLLTEVQGLKSMLADVVKVWAPSRESAEGATLSALVALEGAWIDREAGIHLYAQVIGGDLVVPYSIEGMNEGFTGVYYGWKRAGDHWFARFLWPKADFSGFSFLRQDSLDSMTGAWWNDEEVGSLPSAPPPQEGVPARWERLVNAKFPEWALHFLEEVREEGLSSRLFRGFTPTPDGSE